MLVLSKMANTGLGVKSREEIAFQETEVAQGACGEAHLC
jgi:hypothetical protein